MMQKQMPNSERTAPLTGYLIVSGIEEDLRAFKREMDNSKTRNQLGLVGEVKEVPDESLQSPVRIWFAKDSPSQGADLATLEQLTESKYAEKLTAALKATASSALIPNTKGTGQRKLITNSEVLKLPNVNTPASVTEAAQPTNVSNSSTNNNTNQSRIFQRYVIAAANIPIQEVSMKIADWVEKQQTKDPNWLPSLRLNTSARIAGTPGAGSSEFGPIEGDAVPLEGGGEATTYIKQVFNTGIQEGLGLEAQEDAIKGATKSGNYDYKKPVLTIREKSQSISTKPKQTADVEVIGKEVVILVIDTAPFVGNKLGELKPNPAVDWSGVEAVIDLAPETFTWQHQESDRAAKKGKTDYPVRLKLITDNPKYPQYPQLPSDDATYKQTDYEELYVHAANHHGLMVAKLCKLIAPGARVILVRALDEYGEGDTGQIANFIKNFLKSEEITYEDLGGEAWVTAAGAKNPWLSPAMKFVINMSLVVTDSTPTKLDAEDLLSAIIDKSNQGNTVFTCAAGNTATMGLPPNTMEPAAYGDYPGYGQDFTQVSGPIFRIAAKSQKNPVLDKLLENDPYNMVISVGASSSTLFNYYAFYSHGSPLAAPATTLILDPGCPLLLPGIKIKHVQVKVGSSTETVRTLQSTNGTKPDRGEPLFVSRYVAWSGTSFAAPIVAGQAALLMGTGRELKPIHVKRHIWQTATPPVYWSNPHEVNIAESLTNSFTP